MTGFQRNYVDQFDVVTRGTRSLEFFLYAVCRSFREVKFVVHELELASVAGETRVSKLVLS